MALPKAIQDQIDKVEQFEQTDPAVQAIETDQTGQEEVAQTAETSESGSKTPTQAEPDHRRTELSDAEVQRLRTIEGKYTAEVPRLHTTLREQETAMGTLRDELEALRRKLDESQRQETDKVVTTKDDEVFGTDLVEMVRRVASDELKRVSSSLLVEVDKRLTPLREQMGHVSQAQAMTAEDRFWARLAEAVPDWETINGGESWQHWLSEFDPVAGMTRQVALDQAQKKMDSGRVAAMFKLFKSQDPAFAKSAEATNQTNRANQELRRQVAPPKSKASPSTPQGEKIWSQAEYRNAMDPRMKAEIGYEAWVRLQDEADKAFQDGRVR